MENKKSDKNKNKKREKTDRRNGLVYVNLF